LSIFQILKIGVSFREESTMKSQLRHETGFARPNCMLRPRIIQCLARFDRLTAVELAGMVYGRKIILRPGYRIATLAQIVATRRALRRLVRKGRVAPLGKRCRRITYALTTSPLSSTTCRAIARSKRAGEVRIVGLLYAGTDQNDGDGRRRRNPS
jgi:hypothetical protein